MCKVWYSCSHVTCTTRNLLNIVWNVIRTFLINITKAKWFIQILNPSSQWIRADRLKQWKMPIIFSHTSLIETQPVFCRDTCLHDLVLLNYKSLLVQSHCRLSSKSMLIQYTLNIEMCISTKLMVWIKTQLFQCHQAIWETPAARLFRLMSRCKASRLFSPELFHWQSLCSDNEKV